MKKTFVIVMLLVVSQTFAQYIPSDLPFSSLSDSALEQKVNSGDIKVAAALIQRYWFNIENTIYRKDYHPNHYNEMSIKAINVISNSTDIYSKYLLGVSLATNNTYLESSKSTIKTNEKMYGMSVKTFLDLRVSAYKAVLTKIENGDEEARHFYLKNMLFDQQSYFLSLDGTKRKGKIENIEERYFRIIKMGADKGNEESIFRMFAISFDPDTYFRNDIDNNLFSLYPNYFSPKWKPNLQEADFWFQKLMSKPVSFYFEAEFANNNNAASEAAIFIAKGFQRLYEQHKDDEQFKEANLNWMQAMADFLSFATETTNHKFDFFTKKISQLLDYILMSENGNKVNITVSADDKINGGFMYYKGRFNTQKEKNGKVKSIFKNDSTLTGTWENNKLINGDGYFNGKNGYVYKGHITNGNANGYGLVYYGDPNYGDTFKGYFNDGVPISGTYYWHSIGATYTGKFCGNNKCGYGTYKRKDGSVYNGNFDSATNHFNGNGTMTYSNGKKFVGVWKGGKPLSGSGAYTTNQNDFFVGNYANGQPTGKGKFIWAEGNEISGEWINGTCAVFEAKNSEIITARNEKRKALEKEELAQAERLRKQREEDERKSNVCPVCNGTGQIEIEHKGEVSFGTETRRGATTSYTDAQGNLKYSTDSYTVPTTSYTKAYTEKSQCGRCKGTGHIIKR